MNLRWSLPLMLIAATSITRAQSAAESEYLRIRRAAEDAFEARRPGYDVRRDQKAVLADLERRLQAIVGPINPPGFQKPGRYYLNFLCRSEEDCGLLDALTFTDADRKNVLMATTTPLMSAWLAAHGKDSGDVAAALRSRETVNSALGSFAKTYHYADLQIPDTSRRGVVSAWLARRGDDIGKWPPTQVMVTMMRRNRVYIIQMGFTAPEEITALCGARWDSTWKAREASGLTPQQIDADSIDADYRRCYGEHRPMMPGIDGILARVKTLIDALPPGASVNYGLSDKEALQGTWRVADARARMSNEPAMIIDGMVDVGTVEFSGDTITMRGLGHGDRISYSFTLDTTALLRRIRLVNASEPDSGRWVGIYRVSGDTLHLSLPIEHFSDRPVPPAGFNAPNTAAYIFTRREPR